ncbi:thiopeptide-type bacteriocin biosynthesis protein [Fluviispira multicolorata]|uniref:Thiopeptide-type bacteriocin biosynthesis domain-containing protein n=1 Tax=Fluviispira multicolorata TaxID=2654512 RepID=A0A833JBE1_9BACT|nr:thiopeptide-type bacteriocin biosynthesis protein [Fluviispira multicolorata]KAB8029142.1 hypothetical protein GCL57_11425 [Fluviispira multicolorata]
MKVLEIDKIDSELMPDSIEIYAQIFKDKNKLDLQTFVKDIEQKYPDTLFCELLYSSPFARNANVALSESYWQYRLYLDTFEECAKTTLKLEDIVVCADFKRLYFKSIKFQKEVVFVASHVLNFQNAPNIIRFMREISYEKYVLWNSFYIDELASLTFVPRIEYQNIIVSPRTWNLTLHSLKLLKENFNFKNDFMTQFKAWQRIWNVPRIINLVQIDNKILLDLSIDLHVHEIMKDLVRYNKVILQENLGVNFSEQSLDNLIFNEEVILPFKANKEKTPSLKLIEKCISKNYPKIFYPGSEWLYCKIYVNNMREEELISNYLSEFINEIKNEIKIESWFFIRYQDPKKHIRFRVLLKDKSQYAILLNKLNFVFTFLHKKGIKTRHV